MLIERFVTAARTALAGLPTVKLAADSIALTMERLQANRLLIAGMEDVPLTRAATNAGRTPGPTGQVRAELDATRRLGNPHMSLAKMPAKVPGRRRGDPGVWRTARSLETHFKKHGAEMGAASANEYSSRASDVLQRAINDGLPRKGEPKDGSIRVFDPVTTEFGRFRADGATITYFKAPGVGYFDRQPGGLQ